jgi:beta-lactamase class A
LIRRCTALLALLLGLSVAAISIAAQPDYDRPGDLSPRQDQALRLQLQKAICAVKLCPLIAEDRLAVALVVFDSEKTRLALLNGHLMMYAASLPKLAILLGAMVASQRGELVIDAALNEDIQNMIRVSCNDCATRVLEKVGREQLLDILREPEYAFYDETRSGGLWVGKDYAASAAFARDPIHHLSHGATAYQVARLYYRLDTGDLLDAHHTGLMLDALSDPGIEHKFVAGLSKSKVLTLWRKSGTWRDFHADSALVASGGQHYIMVALVEDPDGEAIVRSLAQIMHGIASGPGDAP